MQCIICHGEDIFTETVQEEIRLGEDIARVSVTAMVCRSCGERYFDRQTVRYLEDVERKLKAGEIQVRQTGKVLVCE